MSDWKEHVKDSKERLGNGWDVVHHWLDEYAGVYWPSKIHRVHRHHVEGIQDIRKMWGDEAAKSAEMHILKDEGDILTKEQIEKKYGVKNENNKEVR